MSNEHIIQMGIHNVSREEYWMDEAERAQERIAELERNLAYYKEQARLYQNDSMQIIYDAQQVDPLLYLVEDASAVPVMQRVLERLAALERERDAARALFKRANQLKRRFLGDYCETASRIIALRVYEKLGTLEKLRADNTTLRAENNKYSRLLKRCKRDIEFRELGLPELERDIDQALAQPQGGGEGQ